MPKGKKRSKQEDRRWLEEYETGKGLQEIATESRRATSTVWTGIEAARKEREDLKVRAHLLQDAYGQHFGDLFTVVKTLAEEVAEPNAEGLIRPSDVRTDLLQEALRSHIPDSPLWGAVREWRLAAKELLAATRDLGADINGQIDKVPRGVGTLMHRESVARSLSFAVAFLAKGQEPSHMQYEDSPEALRWGSYPLSREGANETTRQRIRTAHARLLERVASPEAVKRHSPHVQRWEEAKQAVALEVEKLVLRRILPGSCDLCPGQVTGARRRTRKKGGSAR